MRLNNQGDPVLNLSSPPGITPGGQRRSIEAVADLNRLHAEQKRDPEITSRIAGYALAFRMQARAPQLFDLAATSPRTLADYGVLRRPPDPQPGAFCESQREAAATFAR